MVRITAATVRTAASMNLRIDATPLEWGRTAPALVGDIAAIGPIVNQVELIGLTGPQPVAASLPTFSGLPTAGGEWVDPVLSGRAGV
jgi:hypothetical protein